LPDGELTFLGAVRHVTGAMTRVEVQGTRLLFDCGIAQGRAARHWSFPEGAEKVDASVLTHGHLDHVGSLPTLIARGFQGPIYATRATLDLATYVLSDSIRLQGGNQSEAQAFVRELQQRARPIAYDTPFFIGPAELAFRDAGHIVGSASIELLTEKTRLIHSGDLGRPSSPLLRDPNTAWSAERPVDLVVMESTYGDREHEHTHAEVEKELERIVKNAVRDGGHILIPAFAIGRTQTLIYHLNTLIESGRIPNLPVAIDTPLGLRVTELYNRSRSLFDRESLEKLAHGDDPLDFTGLYAVKRGRDSARLRDVGDSMIIIAGSGMCTGGRIVGHLRELLPDPRTNVLFVGYQAEGTPGRAIQNAARGQGTVQFDGGDVAVRAKIETLSGLSAHAGRSELGAWLRAIPGVKRVALHHGEEQGQRGFCEWVG
jgi:metallo-beta-lactamase family protein